MEDISLAVLFADVVCCMTGGDVPGECVLTSIAFSSSWPLCMALRLVFEFISDS